MMKGHFHVRKKVNWRTEIQDMTLINSKEVCKYIHMYTFVYMCTQTYTYVCTYVHVVFYDFLVPRTEREIERNQHWNTSYSE